MRLTRIEFTNLLVRITNVLPDMPEGSVNRKIALTGYVAGSWRQQILWHDPAMLPAARRPARTG
jgi:hypothetical protein